ncbi:MAG: 6-carboxytetrahydropterin synthase QueD [Desulfobacterales bacterium]|nr:6-carboxytetrahydropterin synthase QueD [Desulfobacterales bacterium]
MFELKIITTFAAAHQLKMVAKKCENLHGHNWKIEVCVVGNDLTDAGIVMDFGQLKNMVSEITSKLDHKYLNDLPFFHENNSSSENIAKYIANELSAQLASSHIKVSKVTAWESDDAAATYIC